jgi:hypothetical protein
MSFILDALRKSENSRLRQNHPAVFSHRSAEQRHRLPVWAMVLIALLAINLLVIAFLLLQSTATESDTPAEIVAPSPVARTPIAPLAPASSLPPGSPPAPATTTAPPPTRSSHSSGVITRNDLLARGTSLPTVDVNMHVYDANPSMRFVLLNGQRLKEGESSKEGLLLERITPEGVVLRYGNNTFAVNLQ